MTNKADNILEGSKYTSTQLAKNIRINTINMVNRGGSSHIGAVLSISDIVAVLYADIMKYKPDNPEWVLRDRFILSKGHAGACVYAALAEVGFFSKNKLLEHYSNGSIFSGHVSHKNVPGVEVSTGSLGHGLPIATGLALAAKLDKRNNRVFVLLGDGEIAEGSNWEAMLFAAHNKLNNLVMIIDRNQLQSLTTTEKTLALEPLDKKFEAFNWEVCVIDGHSHGELRNALSQASENKPLAVIANTTKGKGVSYMENSVEWHYKTPKDNLFIQAIEELEAKV